MSMDYEEQYDKIYRYCFFKLHDRECAEDVTQEAQALLNDPKLLILDEPTAGLDPKERVRFRNLLEALGKDTIVLLSTHIVSDVEHIADTILMMKKGQLIYEGKWDSSQGDLEEFYLEHFEEETDYE